MDSYSIAPKNKSHAPVTVYAAHVLAAWQAFKNKSPIAFPEVDDYIITKKETI